MKENNAKIFEGKLPSPGSFSSCFAFSVHKAGSSLMNGMIRDACKLEGIPAINIPEALFQEGILDAQWQSDESLLPLIRDGIVYCGFRSLPVFLVNGSVLLRSKRSVLLVRDPRDALVSQYFSFGRGSNSSHAVPKKNERAFLEQRAQTVDTGIDNYVVAAAPVHREKLENYKANLDFSLVKVFRYEDIFFNKKSFLEDIFNHFEIPISQKIMTEVSAKHDVRPVAEDIGKHIRKATPGDHVDKLRPGTIAYLNEFFAETCAGFGYRIG